MNRVSILDCTLRDGGYVNNFRFGEKIIKDIIKKLSKASIDIIECGFLESGKSNADETLFGSVEDIKYVIQEKNENLMYVAMIQYGKISAEEISDYDGSSIDGIRLTFHEHEIEEAFVVGKELMKKGYKVFMQPVGTMTYTDTALLDLINKINILRPFAFYMVDTLGTMYKNDLLRMFYLIDHNLNKNIVIGFHSHNNLQLSFANAQELMQLNTPRKLIIDASVFGMGRGAGNLNTELATQYINANLEFRYDNITIMEIIDKYIRPLSMKYRWGYDAAYYIASVTGCHPNYASFLMNKQTLHIQDIYAILNNLAQESRALFDKEYIGACYIHYMNHRIDDSQVLTELRDVIGNKNILLLAPGKSLKKNMQKIKQIAKQDCFIICVNFMPLDIPVDMMFVSNMKRFRNIEELKTHGSENVKLVVTSNITCGSDTHMYVVDYASYINEEQCIADNAGLMCINFLNKLGVKNIMLAGFDGFSANTQENFFETSMCLDVESDRLQRMNIATSQKLVQLGTQLNISFLTKSMYQKDGGVSYE